MPIIEKRYAEALVNIADQTSEIDSYLQDFGSIKDIFESVAEFRAFLLSPQTETKIKKDALQKIFDGKVREDIINFIKLLLDKGRIKHLPGIYAEFVKMADERRNILDIKIYSSSTLTDNQLITLTEKYKKLYKAASVKTEVIIDESLIGGIKVVIGDKLRDGTVKGKLNDLMELLVKS